MAMQSQAPNTQMGPNMMLPLLLMDDSSDNQDLIFYMMMSQQKPAHCEPIPIPAIPEVAVLPEQPTETVFRTWRVNADGTKTLISESDSESRK